MRVVIASLFLSYVHTSFPVMYQLLTHLVLIQGRFDQEKSLPPILVNKLRIGETLGYSGKMLRLDRYLLHLMRLGVIDEH